jgi:hypothetical protein
MGSAKTSNARANAKKPIKEQRKDALDGLGQLAQVPLLATKQFADAGAVGVHWPNISKELSELAESQPAIASVIDPLIKVGPYTGLVAAILPFFMQIAVNHGRVTAGAMGTVPANALAAQIEASLAAAEMEALQSQLEAEKAAQQIRDRIKQQRKDMADSQASQATEVEHVA